MKDAIKGLAFHYFREIANSGEKDKEELEYRADKFVEEIARLIRARKDFEED